MCIFLNSTWRTAAILEIVFGHNSAVDFPISVKFCTGMQNSTLSAWTSSFLRQHGLATGRRIPVQKKEYSARRTSSWQGRRWGHKMTAVGLYQIVFFLALLSISKLLTAYLSVFVVNKRQHIYNKHYLLTYCNILNYTPRSLLTEGQ